MLRQTLIPRVIIAFCLTPLKGFSQCNECPGTGLLNSQLSDRNAANTTYFTGGSYNTYGGEFVDIQTGSNNFGYGGENGVVGIGIFSNSNYSFAFGRSATVGSIDSGSFAFGLNASVQNNSDYSMAFGKGVSIENNSFGSLAFGKDVNIGQNNQANNSFVFGRNIMVNERKQFRVGWGTPIFNVNEDGVTANRFLEVLGGGFIQEELEVDGPGSAPTLSAESDRQIGFSKSNPDAPYQFEETDAAPIGFPSGQGKANIVQNYSEFPFFKNTGPNTNDAKWLALGERPPGNNNIQIAYGLGNVWQNNSGNFVLLDQKPERTSGQSNAKDVAITFQDVGPTGSLTNPSNARNKLRFIFRNSNKIQNSNSKFEVARMLPTGEVLINNTSKDGILDVHGKSTNGSDFSFYAANTNGDPSLVARNNQKVFVSTETAPSSSSGEELIVDGGIYGQSLNIPSDMRLKRDTQMIRDPFEKLAKLHGYTYYYEDNKYTEGFNFSDEKQAGLIAQELKNVMPEAVKKGKNGIYSINYNAVIPLLVQAHKKQMVQNRELKQQLRDEKAQNDEQEERIEKLEEKVNTLADQIGQSDANRFKNTGEDELNQKTVSIEEKDQGKAMLLQNRPNPYSNETVIPFFLPENFQEANILITNIQGSIIKRISLDDSGKGELTLKTTGLDAGQYQYSLMVDGRKIETRKMIISRK